MRYEIGVTLLLLITWICLGYEKREDTVERYESSNEEQRRTILSNLLDRVERIERTFNVTALNPDLDDMSYLELFWEDIKSKVMAAIPTSDPACRFSWRTGSCAPKCMCAFNYKLGDYSLSRACRVKDSLPSNCTKEVEQKTNNNVERIMYTIKTIQTIIADNIASRLPPTDEDCTWNMGSLKCIPETICELKFKLGDLNLNRACRIREVNLLDDYKHDSGNKYAYNDDEANRLTHSHDVDSSDMMGDEGNENG